MTDIEYIAFPLIALVAFYLKGVTGTGTTTVVVAGASFIIDPKLAIVLASFINIFGGFSMIKVDPVPLKAKYWIPLGIAMAIGSVIGAGALKIIDPNTFRLILGITFLLASLWSWFRVPSAAASDVAPEKPSAMDLYVASFSGFCGGFVGINAPSLVFHFGHYLNKRALRRLLVLIFIPAAIAQTATFAVNGLLTKEIMIYGLLMLPFMAIGIYIGNQSFHRISEVMFRRILALFLIIVSVKLIYSGLV